MLTREQKIDFLKCCIAAYEHPRVWPKLGFCYYIQHYYALILKKEIGYGYFMHAFPQFYNYLGLSGDSKCGRYDDEGYKTRAKLAREFLKSEYGIEVK